MRGPVLVAGGVAPCWVLAWCLGTLTVASVLTSELFAIPNNIPEDVLESLGPRLEDKGRRRCLHFVVWVNAFKFVVSLVWPSQVDF